jgi:ParB family chromosome partitioning protein
MKSAESLMARLGGNMAESMAPANGAPVAPVPGVLHGEAGKYKGAARLKDALSIKVDQIIPDPDQPRKDFDPERLAELAASLKARGQLQPIRVRWDQAAGRWVIIAGERRYRAAIMAGLPTLVCIEATGQQAPEDVLEDQLVENCLRTDLLPIEQAQAFRALMDRRGWSYRQLGAALHLSSSHITKVLALLDLPEDLQARVTTGELAPSVAYEVSRLESPEQQRAVAARVVDEGLTRSEATEAVRQVASRSKGQGGKPRVKSKGKPDRLPAEIKHRGGGGCRVVVQTTAKTATGDVVAALRELADRLEREAGAEAQEAA